MSRRRGYLPSHDSQAIRLLPFPPPASAAIAAVMVENDFKLPIKEPAGQWMALAGVLEAVGRPSTSEDIASSCLAARSDLE